MFSESILKLILVNNKYNFICKFGFVFSDSQLKRAKYIGWR